MGLCLSCPCLSDPVLPPSEILREIFEYLPLDEALRTRPIFGDVKYHTERIGSLQESSFSMKWISPERIECTNIQTPEAVDTITTKILIVDCEETIPTPVIHSILPSLKYLRMYGCDLQYQFLPKLRSLCISRLNTNIVKMYRNISILTLLLTTPDGTVDLDLISEFQNLEYLRVVNYDRLMNISSKSLREIVLDSCAEVYIDSPRLHKLTLQNMAYTVRVRAQTSPSYVKFVNISLPDNIDLFSSLGSKIGIEINSRYSMSRSPSP